MWNGKRFNQGSPEDAGGTEMKQFFSFPNPVNEVSARLVAAGVVMLSVLVIVLDQPLLLLVLAYGFLARACSPGRLSVRSDSS